MLQRHKDAIRGYLSPCGIPFPMTTSTEASADREAVAFLDGREVEGMATEEVYEWYLLWCSQVGIPPMRRRTAISAIRRASGLVVRSARTREGTYACVLVKPRPPAVPADSAAYSAISARSSEMVREFMEHPPGSWEGWTYERLYGAYVSSFGKGSGMVPLPYGRFRREFSVLWRESGGSTMPKRIGGRTARILVRRGVGETTRCR